MRTASAQSTFILAVFVILCTSCDSGVEIPKPSGLAEIVEFSISENPHNVLSAVGRVRTNGVTIVRIDVASDSGMSFSTPLKIVQHEATLIPILGLESDQTYWAKAIAISQDGKESTSSPVNFATGSLPGDIPRLVIHEYDDPAPGFAMIGFTGASTHAYTVIFNNEGKPLWYRRFEGSVIDFQKQPNNNYTVCVARPGFATQFYEIDVLGTVIRSYQAKENRETDVHELRIAGDSHVLFGIEYREMDLTTLGGLQNARVKGIVVEYHRPATVPLYWNTFDHLKITDAANNISLLGQNVNPWHGNAIEIDTDGHLLLSFRHCEEI